MDNLNNEIIAEIYARPLLELATESQCTEKIGNELAGLCGVLAEERDFADFLDSPFIQTKEKVKAAENIFSDRIDRLTAGFLVAVINRKRIRLMDAIATAYNCLLDEQNGIKLINVTLASAPSQQQYEQLCAQLGEAVGAKVKVMCDIDPSILGGIIIRQEGTYIDNSLRRILLDAKVRIRNIIKT